MCAAFVDARQSGCPGVDWGILIADRSLVIAGRAMVHPSSQHTLAGPRENLPQPVVSASKQRTSSHIAYLPEHLQISLPTACIWNTTKPYSVKCAMPQNRDLAVDMLFFRNLNLDNGALKPGRHLYVYTAGTMTRQVLSTR